MHLWGTRLKAPVLNQLSGLFGTSNILTVTLNFMCEAIVGRVIACNSFLLIPPNKRDKTLVFSEYMMLYGEHEAKERLSP